MLRWWGVNASDNSAYLYRSVPTGIRNVLSDAYIWPVKRRYLAADLMTEDRMTKFYKSLLSIKPKYLVGYVGSIDIFAGFLAANSLDIPGIEAVWTTSAPLSLPKRRFYEDTFRSPIYSQYGSCEFYWIAADCNLHSGLHIGSDVRHVDVVDGVSPVGAGQYGDLVVTDLVNKSFPLLRYRIGDRGRLMENSCSCGLPFPLMDYVKGRIADMIVLPSGSRVPGEFWTTIFDDFPEVISEFFRETVPKPSAL